MKIKEWFRYFFRKTYPDQTDVSNEDIDELGEDFDKHLRGKFSDEEILKWYPTSIIEVLVSSGHPFKHHGFSLPLAYHFFDYISMNVKEQKNDI